MNDDQLSTELRTLRRLDVRLEEALREAMEVKAINTLDVQIHRVRREVTERIQNINYLLKEQRKGQQK
jgi:hypothetical protein